MTNMTSTTNMTNTTNVMNATHTTTTKARMSSPPATRRPLVTRLTRLALGALTLALLAAAPRAASATPARSRPGATRAEARPPAGAAVVNLNTASEEELMRLPGVGPAKAAAIAAWRTRYGTFKRVEDLVKVKGFARKTLARLRPFLAVTGATTLDKKPGRTPPAAAHAEAGTSSP